MYPAGIPSEHLADQLEILGRLQHQLAGIALGDLDVALEHGVVSEAQLQRGNRHGLRDGAEVEDALLSQAGEIEQTVLHVLERVQDHLGVAVERRLAVLGLEQVLEVGDVLGPDLLGPEVPVVVMVLPDVTDDVRLLQEQAHRVVQTGPLQQGRVAKLGLDEQAGQALSDQTGHVMAIQVVFLDGLDAGVLEGGLAAVVGHAVAHLVGDVLDDGLVGGLHLLELGDDVVELNQQFPVLLLGAVAVEGPAVLLEEVLEAAQQGLLGLERDGGVILDGVEAAQDEVEDADGDEQLGMQLLDDGAEAATGLFKEFEADLLRLGL